MIFIKKVYKLSLLLLILTLSMFILFKKNNIVLAEYDSHDMFKYLEYFKENKYYLKLNTNGTYTRNHYFNKANQQELLFFETDYLVLNENILAFSLLEFTLGDEDYLLIYENNEPTDIELYFSMDGIEVYCSGELIKYYDARDTKKNLYFTLEITLDFAPVFSGETAFVTNIDDPISVNEIKSHLKAYDDIDGDVTHRIEIYEDEYTPNNHRLGEFEVIFRVSDYSNNYSYLTVIVFIRDVTPPVITGQNYYEISMEQELDIDYIRNNLNVSDNYDESLNITIKENNYTSNKDVPGIYNIIFTAKDTSNNITEYIVQVKVIDDVKPVFNGVKTISKNQDELLTVSDIKKQLTAFDNYDGDITDKIEVKEDNYTGKGNKVGTYKIIFSVKDKAGNETLHEVTINVIDNLPPIFYIDNYFITVQQGYILSNEEIIEILRLTGQIEVTTNTYITFLLNEYEGNENEVGKYPIIVEVKDKAGNEKVINSIINVIENDDYYELEPKEPVTKNNKISFYKPVAWYEWIIAPFVWLWNCLQYLWYFITIIIEWIKNLF